MSTERPDNDAAVPRRKRRPLAVASVAAAVLLAGGGGAYFAATTSGGDGRESGAPSGDGSTPPPLALDGYTESPGEGIAPGEPDPNGATYRATGKLPEGPDSAAVYRARGEVSASEVTRLAKALGVEGTPKVSDGTWRVGPAKDGSGPSLQVTKQAPGTWTFSRYAPGASDDCKSATKCSNTGTPGGEGDAVSEQVAKKAAAPVLKALGQDDAKLDARQLMGAVRVVNADPKIGGLPTYGWSTGIQVGADGQVVGGSGQLAKPVKGDTYPLISAGKTLDLLNRAALGGGRVGIGGCASPVPLEGPEEGQEAKDAPCATAASPATPQTVAVRGATLGLAVHFVDGRQTLVPSWLFDVRPKGAEDSFTITHPAVDPEYLRAADTPSAERAEPSPRPSTPGGGDESVSTPRGVHIESYSVDGRSLTLHFWGGVCSDYSASASESADKVTVTVTETPQEPGKVCIMIAKELKETVTLEKPLGDRKVVDATGGGTVPRK
ncbi:hypothetical protein [Streptomyces jeddahensis]|uniref:Large membrane protein n=1 Tax=Streptomyces jeddahensis TaxID=1716141 RepID=A0A177HPQ2_9ACTN|nr:hypothetical protein [Streptomyces jeddahensis]OAH12397.1 hypothetical protein STSP_42940 [Streptomyces jeddahensis]